MAKIYGAVISKLNALENGVELLICNSLWAEKEIKTSFVHLLTSFKAEVRITLCSQLIRFWRRFGLVVPHCC